jgi:ADP-ribose pyrophosphatase YjhB (NUDIX family)
VLVMAGDSILLVRQWHGVGGWTLPGGGIHKGEDPTYAATRELMEETMIALGVDQLAPLGTQPSGEHGIHFTAHYFIAQLHEPIRAVAQRPEISAAAWIPEAELSRHQIHPNVQAALAARNRLLQ